LMGSSCYLGVVLGCIWGCVRVSSIEILGFGGAGVVMGLWVGVLMWVLLVACWCGGVVVAVFWWYGGVVLSPWLS
jgi:hypothetical protein